LQQQLDHLQHQLAKIRADKAFAQLFAGIAGVVLGRALD